jgi:hypothetical protein
MGREMNLNVAVEKIQRDYTCVDWAPDDNRPDHIAPTGEQYVEVYSGGLGDSTKIPCLCLTEEIAVDTWYRTIQAMQSVKSGIIYWRVRPEMATDGTRFFVYSRLLISSNSVIRNVGKKRIAV